MAVDSTLTLAEIAQLFHARLRNIEQFLSSTQPGFNTDIEVLVADEIDTSTLTPAQKTKLKTMAKDFAAGLPKNKK